MSDTSEIVEQLRAIADDLADRAMTVLRQAIDDGETGRPPEERTLTRARAAIERAIGILDGDRGDDV